MSAVEQHSSHVGIGGRGLGFAVDSVTESGSVKFSVETQGCCELLQHSAVFIM